MRIEAIHQEVHGPRLAPDEAPAPASVPGVKYVQEPSGITVYAAPASATPVEAPVKAAAVKPDPDPIERVKSMLDAIATHLPDEASAAPALPPAVSKG